MAAWHSNLRQWGRKIKSWSRKFIRCNVQPSSVIFCINTKCLVSLPNANFNSALSFPMTAAVSRRRKICSMSNNWPFIQLLQTCTEIHTQNHKLTDRIKIYVFRFEILIFQLHQTSLPRHIIIDLIISSVKHNDQWDRNKDDMTIRTTIHIPFVPAIQRLDYHRQQLTETERNSENQSFVCEAVLGSRIRGTVLMPILVK